MFRCHASGRRKNAEATSPAKRFLGRLALSLALLGIVVLGPGCESAGSRTELKGAVAINGNPVEKGTIAFAPLEGPGQAVGSPITRGGYLTRNVPLGKVRVSITATQETGKMIPGYSSPSPEVVNLVPAKYQGGLAVQITSDTHEQNFNLTD